MIQRSWSVTATASTAHVAPFHCWQEMIVRAKPDDAAVLTEIALAAKRHWGYPEKWIEGWRDLLTVRPEFIANNETYAAVLDDRIVGFYALGFKNDRMDLLHMWVLPAAMGRGVEPGYVSGREFRYAHFDRRRRQDVSHNEDSPAADGRP